MHSMIHTILIECDGTRFVVIRSSTHPWADIRACHRESINIELGKQVIL